MHSSSPEQPLARPRVAFSGWWVVAAAMVCTSAGAAPFGIASLGLLMGPLTEEFGWSRTGISWCASILIGATAISIVFVGRLIDRYGPRAVLFASLVITGLCLAAIPLFATNLLRLQLIFLLMGIGGAGTNAITYMPVLSAWFNRRRGLAIGLTVSGFGLGYAYVPQVVQFAIGASGWRAAYYTLSGVVFLIAIPVAWIGIIESPQSKGQYADGIVGPPPAATRKDVGITTRAAVRMRVFWVMMAMFVLLTFVTYGAFVHLVPMLTDRGIHPTEAAAVASVLGIAVFMGRIFIGVLVDRFFAPRVAILAMLLTTIGLVMLALGVSGSELYLAAVFLGLTLGAESDLLAYLSSRYFGVRALGTIFGMQSAAYMGGIVFGPVAFAAGFDTTGSYVSTLAWCAGIIVLAAVLAWTLPRFPTWEDSVDRSVATA